jgi:hypothetical protein
VLFRSPFEASQDKPVIGDSKFYVPDCAIEYNDGDDFETLADRYASICDDENPPEIGGFWIVSDEDLKTAALVWPDDDYSAFCGSDSVTYSLNRAAKAIIKSKSQKVIKKVIKKVITIEQLSGCIEYFTAEEFKVISNALQSSLEFIHEELRDEPTIESAMKAFDTNIEVTALKKVDLSAAARIREFVLSDIEDYIADISVMAASLRATTGGIGCWPCRD